MSATARESGIRVATAADRSVAELVIPPGLNRSMLTPHVCEALLQQAGVEVTEDVRRALSELLSSELPPHQEVKAVVARSVPPVHGKDGYIEWLVESPAEQLDEPEQAKESYYDISAFVMVEAGQVIGKIHPPTLGEDGRDVTGKTLAARDGKECKLKFDETILCDAAGQLVAQEEGVLSRKDDNASICKVLEVADYVDFSTGNIDFDGDVIVSKGVRDLFIVKATGNVEVAGLIEAATIITGHDLVARGGFAGRERGTAQCGSNFTAKYLDNIQGEVAQDLSVDREIINCELTIHGNVDASHGAIIGGRIVVTGTLHVGLLGSPASVPTEIVVGSVPRLEPLCDRLQSFVDKITSRRDELVEEQDEINKRIASRRATTVDKERQTEVMFEISNADQLLIKARPTLENLIARIDAQRTVDVSIERKLFPGVILTVGTRSFQINTEMKGPLRINKDDQGALTFIRVDGSSGLLVQIADSVAAETSMAA